jgi:hypothetical protein
MSYNKSVLIKNTFTTSSSNSSNPTTAPSTAPTVRAFAKTPPVTFSSFIVKSALHVSWNSVPNATSYFIDVSKDSSFNTLIAGYSNRKVKGTVEIIDNLDTNTTYHIRVRAYNIAGTGPNSTRLTVSTQPTIAQTIPAMSNVAIDGFVSVSWQIPPGVSSFKLDISSDNFYIDYVDGYKGRVIISDSSNTVCPAGSLCTITVNVPAELFTVGKTYLARFRSISTLGESENSPPNFGRVFTGPQPPLVPVNLLYIDPYSLESSYNLCQSDLSDNLSIPPQPVTIYLEEGCSLDDIEQCTIFDADRNTVFNRQGFYVNTGDGTLNTRTVYWIVYFYYPYLKVVSKKSCSNNAWSPFNPGFEL